MTELNSVRTVLELLPDPALLVEEGEVLWCNAAAARLAVSSGDNAAELFPPDVPQTGELFAHWDLRWRGTEWEVTARALQGTQVLLLRPIPGSIDADLLLAAARGIQPSLEAMAAAGSSLFSFLEEMEDEAIQAETAKLTRSAFRLLRTAGELSAFARLQQEEVPLCRERCDLTVWFRALADRIAGILPDAGLRLEYHGPGATVYGAIDQEEVRNAVLHLISNAAQFSDEGAAIVLKVSVAGKLLRISVSGNSSANAPSMATAFSAYRQPSSTDPRQGMGLGLPTVQALARRHGGNVLFSGNGDTTEVLLSLDISEADENLNSPKKDLSCGYDPCLVVLSGILPDSTFDSRSVEL